MKVLLAIDYYQPQLGYSEGFIVRGLKKLGHEVTVLTSNYYFPFPDYEQTSGKILGPRCQASGTKMEEGVTVIREPMRFELFARAILGNHEKNLKAIKPDIIIADKVMGYNTIRFAQLKKKYGYKLVSYESHLPSEFYREKVVLKKLLYGLFKMLFSGLLNNQIDKLIAVQSGTVEVMRDFYGIRKEIDVIPLGTDIERFRFDKNERERVRKKYQISNNDFVILYTGKLIESKGVDILFNAFNKLCPKYPNIKLILVGDGKEEYFQKCFSGLEEKFWERVIRAGFFPPEELYKFYSAADVAIWPLQESTSMNDSAACSLPFIANDTLGERVRVSNDNALLYKKGDTKDLAEKIEYLYKNPVIRKKMGENGRMLAENKLSWDSIAKRYLT